MYIEFPEDNIIIRAGGHLVDVGFREGTKLIHESSEVLTLF